MAYWWFRDTNHSSRPLYGYYFSRLPSQRMEVFDKVFEHSKGLFSRAREAGLIIAPLRRTISVMIEGFVTPQVCNIVAVSLTDNIYRLEASSLDARACVYASPQGLGAYMMRRELSGDIDILIERAKALRQLITKSAQEQLQLQSYWRSHYGNGHV
ncbi:hypothetical protein BD779DRAFT_1566965 [Infundibulicybe gibba]|nr:hypothetical protein BD779DRAFT_1566965 [Infundibulicybe gibba]